jgi:hypothetical protein
MPTIPRRPAAHRPIGLMTRKPTPQTFGRRMLTAWAANCALTLTGCLGKTVSAPLQGLGQHRRSGTGAALFGS